jgi:hypothetical protein
MGLFKSIGSAITHMTHSLGIKGVGKTGKAIAGAAIGAVTGGVGGAVLGAGAGYLADNAGKLFKYPDGGTDTTPVAEQQLVDAREESKKRRRALYATKGGEMGEEVESIGNTFGAGRGTLFGN